MGSRASYAIRENGQISLYFSHWGGQSIDEDFFFGPEVAVAHVRDTTATDEILDDVWCEGAAFIDLDSRELVLFGGEDVAYDPDLRSLFMQLLRISWEGWQVEWAQYGIVTIADKLNIPRETVAAIPPPPPPQNPSPKLDAATAKVVGVGYQGLHALVTVKEFDGTVQDYLAAGTDEYLLGAGERLFAYLERCPHTADDALIRKSEWLIYIDKPQKRIHIYVHFHGTIRFGWQQQLEGVWTGWTLVPHTQGLTYHMCLTGRESAKWCRDADKLLSEVREIVTRENTFNPADTVDALRSAGHEVQVTAPGYHNVFKLPLAKATREQFFDEVVSKWKESAANTK